ncbi:hypothetical protein EKE94_08275 [Mesobaculum littorinae]|uniref:Uncharacterized protein n=1 Tax=Mesobaculum littorinae TaxID=2486419 RepID=A0A438AJV2_9RHOB|nr:hypothetical protein [Mesobaculum littorinae]RVV98877.1 hypothetical protein EKE94_08275 [Mesobaculum littorinae]
MALGIVVKLLLDLEDNPGAAARLSRMRQGVLIGTRYTARLSLAEIRLAILVRRGRSGDPRMPFKSEMIDTLSEWCVTTP